MTRYAALAGTLALTFASQSASAQQLVAHEQYPVGARPVAITSADFNNDGSADIAVLNEADNSVTILINDGNGAFTTAATLTTGNAPQDILSGDYNNDAAIDLAIANKDNNSLSLFLGNGAGGFTEQPGSPFPAAASGKTPSALVNLDINGDGNLDIGVANRAATAGATPKVSILLGNGDGSFQAPGEAAVGLFPNDIVSADFNNDGFPDLVTANSNLGSINDSTTTQDANLSFLAGSAGGNLADKVDTPLDFRPSALDSGDFNEDGIEDLVVIQVNSGEGSSRIHILLGEDADEDGQGDGTFVTTDATAYAVGITPSSVTSRDINGDSYLDLVVTHLDSNNLLTLFGHGDGTFAMSEHFYTAGAAPTALTINDFNNDSSDDLAITASDSNKVGILFGRSDGTFQTAMTRPIDTASTTRQHGDFNNDGLTDIATLTPASQQLAVRLRKHRDTFAATTNLPLSAIPQALTVAKLNADNNDDLAIIYRDSTQMEIFLANEEGALSPTFDYELISSPVANPSDIVSADFNSDGHTDLAVTSISSSDILVIPGQGDGSFGDAILLGTGIKPTHLVSRDINKDQSPDLISTNEGYDTLAVITNSGNFSFDNPRNYPLKGDVLGIQSEDYNSDGIPDFLVSYKDSHDLKLFAGNISGKVERTVDFPLGRFTNHLTSGDFNQDQIPDIAGTINDSASLLMLYGNGDGTFRPGVNLAMGKTARLNSLITTDSNNDGIDEIVITDGARGKIYVVDSTDGIAYSLRNTYNSTRLGSSGAVSQVIALDSDQDGKPDLAVTNTDSSNIGVLSGAGDGTYEDISVYETGTAPVSLVSADFNGDGYPDIATANEADLSILLNNGAGGYDEPTPLALPGGGSRPSMMTLGDYNKDGAHDLVVALPDTGQLLVFLGNTASPGTFESGVAISGINLQAPSALSTIDLNQDSFDDLIVTDSGSEEIVILQNTATGNLDFTQLSQNFSAGASPTSHTLADLNMDGGDDIIVSGRNISVMLNSANYIPTPFTIAPVVDAAISSPAIAPVTTTINGIEVVISPGSDAVDIPVDSAPVTISGLDGRARVIVEQGQYAINGAPFTQLAGSAVNGDTIVVRHNTAYSANTTSYASLTVGGYSERFYVTTLDDGSKPDDFTFTAITDAELGSYIDSEPVTITGLRIPARISVRGGWYAINGGDFTAEAGTINNNDTLVARVLTLPSSYEATSSATLTIGGVSQAFNVTTAADQSPDPFDFPDKANSTPSTRALSPWRVIKGISAPTPISIKGGKYALLDDAQNFTDKDGLLPPFARNGNPQKVRISVIAPKTFNSSVEVSITIGDYTDTFTVTTKEGGSPETVTATQGGVEEQNLFGCSVRSRQGDSVDPTLPLLVLFSALALWRRQRQ